MPDSVSTKLRVVFDASVKDLNALSLNDTLLAGPKLQNDLVAVLLKFRLSSFILTAEIKQMYRQIMTSRSQRHNHRILWDFSTDDPTADYQLNTVTHGVSSAPFLAIRTLRQLALEYINKFALASSVILRNT